MVRFPSDHRFLIRAAALPLRRALDFALPARCPGCGMVQADGGAFCRNCWSQVRFLAAPWCTCCGLPFEREVPGEPLCGACLARPPRYDLLRSAVAYGGLSTELVLKLKYARSLGAARMMAGHMARLLPDLPDDVLVTPVPLHWTRLFQRTYNQSVLIGGGLAKRIGAPFEPDLLRRTRRTPPLRSLGAKARAHMVSGVFALRPSARRKIAGRAVLLVDDVHTSGATTAACAAALRRGGARWVGVVTWARVL